jgi:glycosyltransferase involved in cell wall biosynthesis
VLNCIVRAVSDLSITYSIADQHFAGTDSIGVLNLSVQMVHFLAERKEIRNLTVLSNSGLSDRLELPSTVPVRLYNSAVGNMLGRIVWDQWKAYSTAAKMRNRWLFLPKGYASFSRRCPVKLVPCVADTSYDYYRKNLPNGSPKLKQWYFNSCVNGTIKYSDLIFTISDFSGTEIIRLAKELGFKPPPVRTIGIGFYPNTERYEKKQQVLVLASALPHKRTDLAVKYFTRWQERTGFPGTVEWVGKKFPEGVTLPDFPRWRVHPRLPDPEYKKLRGESRALVYFSEYEGFGMPPVEAAIAGTCPVFSDLDATREVMGGTGLSFRNDSYESFERAMNQAVQLPREHVEKWGEELLRRHSWPGVAEKVVRGLTDAERAGTT